MTNRNKPFDWSPSLIERLREGNHSAFETVVGRYANDLRKMLFRRLNLNGHDIDDLTQDVFFRFWRSRERLKETCTEREFRNYLAAIAQNCACDLLRRRSQKAMVRWIDEENIPGDPELDDPVVLDLIEDVACIVREERQSARKDLGLLLGLERALSRREYDKVVSFLSQSTKP